MTRQITAWVTALLLTASAAGAQTLPPNTTGLQLTRDELQGMLEHFERTAADPQFSSSQRNQATIEAAMVRQRLREGDLRTGDRLELVVQGFEELTDTFTVGANRSIQLPQIGEVPLTGVLRAELRAHLTQHIGRFINNPMVNVRSLIRLEISGGVARPGFYAVPADMLVSDALMVAGGPTAIAKLDQISVRRGGEEVWSAARLREAVIEGRTLDQLNIRAGDGIYVASQSASRLDSVRNVVFLISGVATVAVLLIQIF